MGVRSFFANLWGSSKAAPATAGTSLSGRPGYASSLSSLGTIPRSEKFELLAQFYGAIPPLKRAVSVLTGMVGCPEFVSSTEAETNDLALWSAQVGYGRIGQGLGMWLRDHGRQRLVYGFGVGEAEIDPTAKEVLRLHSYSSPRHGFQSDELGEITILQQQSMRGLVPLNPETTVLSVHDPDGGNPNGESLFFSIPTVAQTWLDILHNYRETWRRCGSPVFHVNWEPPENFNDQNHKKSDGVRTRLEEAWNKLIRSKQVDGKTLDFFSTGKVSIVTVGADGQVIDVQEGKRNIVEEIVVASNLPPWLLGYSWSTTERLSTQQADMLVTFIETLRTEITGSIQKLVELRQRVAGKRSPFEIVWPAVNLQDLVQTAQAELMMANAKRVFQAYLRQLWADGVIDQVTYALLLTESEEVATPYDTPQPLPGGAQNTLPGSEAGGTNAGAAAAAARLALPAALREMRGEYRELFARHTCNGRH